MKEVAIGVAIVIAITIGTVVVAIDEIRHHEMNNQMQLECIKNGYSAQLVNHRIVCVKG